MARLIPVDQACFDLLERLAAHLTTSPGHLHGLVADPARAGELVPAVKHEQEAADATLHEIRVRLDRSFVTPFDREDIHALALRIDRVVDLAEPLVIPSPEKEFSHGVHRGHRVGPAFLRDLCDLCESQREAFLRADHGQEMPAAAPPG